MDHLYLAHHGIKGMKWGVRRFRDRGGNLTPAGKKRYGSDDSREKERFWTAERKAAAKKVAKGAAVVAGIALVAYGGYRLSRVSGSRSAEIGQNVVDKFEPRLYGDASTILPSGNKAILRKTTLETVNPLRGTPQGKNNCTSCGVASALQQIFGVKATAISTGGAQQDLVGVVQDCFSGAKHLTAGNSRSITSLDSASSFLVKRFGTDAEGVIGIPFGINSGHTFNWSIKQGAVEFYDGQNGIDNDVMFFGRLFAAVDPERPFDAIRLDCATPLLDKLAEYVRLDG